MQYIKLKSANLGVTRLCPMNRIHQWCSMQMLSPAGKNLMIPGGQEEEKNLKRCDCTLLPWRLSVWI